MGLSVQDERRIEVVANRQGAQLAVDATIVLRVTGSGDARLYTQPSRAAVACCATAGDVQPGCSHGAVVRCHSAPPSLSSRLRGCRAWRGLR